jgi:hypothetical protein
MQRKISQLRVNDSSYRKKVNYSCEIQMQYVSYLINDHHFVRHVKLNGFFHSDSLGRILKVIFVLGIVWKGSFRGGAGAVLEKPLLLLFFPPKNDFRQLLLNHLVDPRRRWLLLNHLVGRLWRNHIGP